MPTATPISAIADFVRVPVAGLIDPAYLAARSRLISPDRAIAHVERRHAAGRRAPRRRRRPQPRPARRISSPSTAAGNVASYTSTIESVFGSGLTVNGMFLNNELTDFNFAPEPNGAPVANRVEGGKRPRSSMSPTIVYGPDGRVRIAIGAAGGTTIIAQVAKALIGVLDWDLCAQDAIALPQIMGLGDRVTIERGTRLEAMIPALQALGQRDHHRRARLQGQCDRARQRPLGRRRRSAQRRDLGGAVEARYSC